MNQIVFYMSVNAILIYYFSTCKQADLQYASYMSVCLRKFTCLCSCMPFCYMICASQWILHLKLCMGMFLHVFSSHCIFTFFFLIWSVYDRSVWESFWSRGLNHFEQARWGQRSEREATLVPCHHPKTELLQNILKCLRVLDTEI